MRFTTTLGVVLSMGMLAGPAFAGPILNPSATYQSTALGGGDFDYKITLTDSASSPVPIGTFWFSWTPGKDFMNVAPISVISPAGWTDMVTNNGPGTSDGFAIQWVAGAGAALAPGNSLVFEFTSTETPAQLLGNSPFYPTTPEGTTVVYSGAPFSDAGTTFVATAAAVPEPSSLALMLVGGLALVARKRFGRRARA